MPTDNEQLTTLLDPVVQRAGLVLEDVAVSTVGRRRLVRVVVDLPESETGSADLDRVAEASREVGDALDASDVLGQDPYALEVTTPGVDRPLTERRHWLRARTRLVRAERDGQDPLTGRLVEVTDEGLVLLVTVTRGKPAWKQPATSEERVDLRWDEVVRGVIEVEFRDLAAHDAGDDDADDLADDDLEDDELEDDELEDDVHDDDLHDETDEHEKTEEA
ncbi:ribosome maturation factor RimP [Aquipuribacter hungaricus]|uniref:Ribosome maturation factor RimP n=1 Tax=Aquipuribacter hungaricus TaxID=545624 RepID=A0ABV7WEU9_9MICO